MRNPRGSLGGAGAVLAFAALLALFAVALTTTHGRARRSLEAAFNEHARVTAALTNSLFSASAGTTQAAYAAKFGSARVTDGALTALAREGKSVDAALIGPNGSLIAISAGTPRAVRHELESRPAYISSVLAGQRYAISNVIALGAKQSLVQYAQPFNSASGRRIVVVGFAPSMLSGFIDGYLAGTTTTRGSRAFVLDGNGVPIASAAHDARPPMPPAEPGLARALGTRASGPIGRGRYFTMAPIRNSAWRVIVTTPQTALFASVEGLNEWLPWILFGAFALVLALVLMLGARTLRNAAAQRERDAQFRAVVAERLGLAAITETMAEGVVVTRHADMRIVYTNQAFDAMLGYERNELRDEPVSRIGPHARAEPRRSQIDDSVKSAGSWRGELQLRRKDGSQLWCLSNVTTLEHPEHGAVWIAVHNDISDRKRIESELERASAQAIEASRSKSQFVANMSHEIRTPLNGVIGMTDLLRETALGPVQREYVDALATSGEALLALISDVLDFSKIEAGRLELDPTDFSLRPAVEEACQILARQAHGKGLEISHWVDDDVPVAVRGDRARLRQILLNLISNAVKFTAHGEVSVRVRREGDSSLRFSVSDTGVGIDTEQAAQLFEAFVQADQSTTREYGGTGLGLTISSQLVRLMGGDIGAETREQGGSTFWFTAELPEVESASRPLGAPELQDVRALVVDESATSRTILSHYLSSWGLACESVADVPGALDALQSAARADAPFQLVLLDANMPRVSGPELARSVRERAPFAQTKLIVLSATALEREAFADAEVSAFFTKPARQSELHNAIVSAFAELPATLESENEQLPEAIAQIRGHVVLIAEDNDINVALTRAMLHKRGLQTAVARNGSEAVQMAQDNDYAAILMDCQMPELDGYEATRRIRGLENGHRVPIIALTAHSMAGDRERCIAVGMDDYLPKPIRVDQLEEVIKRWLPEASGAGGRHDGGSANGEAECAAGDRNGGHADERGERSAEESVRPAANGPSVLDAGTLAQLKETLNEAMRGRLLETFSAQLESCVEEIATAVQRGDADERRRIAHLLKGSSATIGATRLSVACERLERSGRASDPDVGEEQVAELRALALQARRELEQQLL
jgi:PAS domain S-box-containing protein